MHAHNAKIDNGFLKYYKYSNAFIHFLGISSWLTVMNICLPLNCTLTFGQLESNQKVYDTTSVTYSTESWIPDH